MKYPLAKLQQMIMQDTAINSVFQSRKLLVLDRLFKSVSFFKLSSSQNFYGCYFSNIFHSFSLITKYDCLADGLNQPEQGYAQFCISKKSAVNIQGSILTGYPN